MKQRTLRKESCSCVVIYLLMVVSGMWTLGCQDSVRQVVSYRLEHRLSTTDQTLDIDLRNPFSESITLDGFRTSCSCSQPTYEPTIIAPQSSRRVRLTVDTNRMASSMPNGGSVLITPILKSNSSGLVSDGIPFEIAFKLTRGLVCSKSYVYLGLGQSKQRCEIESAVPCRLEIYSNVEWLTPTFSASQQLGKVHEVELELLELDEYLGSSEATVTFKAFDSTGGVVSSISIIAKRIETCPIVLDYSIFESDKSDFVVNAKLFIAPGLEVTNVSCRSLSEEIREVSVQRVSDGRSIKISGLGPEPFKDGVSKALLLFECGVRTCEVPVYVQFQSK